MKAPRKPKTCQWMSGVCSLNASTWTSCKAAPKFKVMCATRSFNAEICVGWVCATHASNVISQQLGQLS